MSVEGTGQLDWCAPAAAPAWAHKHTCALLHPAPHWLLFFAGVATEASCPQTNVGKLPSCSAPTPYFNGGEHSGGFDKRLGVRQRLAMSSRPAAVGDVHVQGADALPLAYP